MSHTQLPHTMQRLALGGPHDQATWRKVISRAEVIAHTFNSKDAALMVNAFAKARNAIPEKEMGRFLRRFFKEYGTGTMEKASAMDLSLLSHGLSVCGVYSRKLFDQLSSRLNQETLDCQQLSLVANAFARESHTDAMLLSHLLKQAERQDVVDALNGQSLALFLNALAQLGDEVDIPEVLIRKAPEVDMDITSLSLLLNSLARLKRVDKDCLDLLAQQVEEKIHTATPRQLGMLFNAAGKLQLCHPRMIDSLLSHMRRVRNKFDALSLVLVCNAAAKLRLPPEVFQDLYETIPRLLGSMGALQLAMLSHAWAKAHVYNDDLYELLKHQLERAMRDLDSHAVALTAYGFAHFRKELPRGLIERLHEHLETSISDKDLLMTANAFARMGVLDSRLRDALLRLDAHEHLTPKAQSLFLT